MSDTFWIIHRWRDCSAIAFDTSHKTAGFTSSTSAYTREHGSGSLVRTVMRYLSTMSCPTVHDSATGRILRGVATTTNSVASRDSNSVKHHQQILSPESMCMFDTSHIARRHAHVDTLGVRDGDSVVQITTR